MQNVMQRQDDYKRSEKMKKFIEWLENQNTVSSYSKKLFMESYFCYRNENNRSAFIMSYLGLYIAIRDRVLEVHNRKPDYFDTEKWSELIDNMQNVNIWEGKLFDEINKGNATSLFLLQEPIRDSMRHWREERNAAVHGKKEVITGAQIEYFLDFVMNSLSLFYVGGGEAYVEQRVFANFNSITSTSEYSFKEDIEFIYHTKNLVDFKEWIRTAYRQIDQIQNRDSNKIVEFWNTLITNKKHEIYSALISTAKQEMRFFRYLKEISPVIPDAVYQDKEFVKKLIDEIPRYYYNEEGIMILKELSERKTIEQEVVQTSVKKLAELSHDHIHWNVVHKEDLLNFLLENSYLEGLRSLLLSKPMRDFETAFSNERPFLFLIEHGEIDHYLYELMELYLKKMYTSSTMSKYLVELLVNKKEVLEKISGYEKLIGNKYVSDYIERNVENTSA